MPQSQILYRIHAAPGDLFQVFNDPAEIAAGTFHIQGTVEQTINLCRDELNKANFDVMQLGRHKLLGCKLENRSWSAATQGLQIELLVEQVNQKELLSPTACPNIELWTAASDAKVVESKCCLLA